MNASSRYVLIASVLAGMVLGVGAFTFIYAEGHSYLSNDPAACSNCHIMNDHFDAWTKSSHQAVAVCNDCHTPSGFIRKYLTKADNGFWHSVAFTTGDFPDPIRIKPRNREVTEEACLKCHAGLTASMMPGAHLTGGSATLEADQEKLSCIRCHADVGHWVR